MKRLFAIAFTLLFATTAHAVEMGDDGLHKTPWMRDTFKDLNEDLEEANAEGKRLMIMFEQRGCIYCTKMHEDVFPDERITKFIEDNYFVVQLNLHGSTEVTDFDGETLGKVNDGSHGDVREMAEDFVLYGTLAEIFARQPGFNKGLGGSMHAFFTPFGSMPNNAIVGGSGDISVGSAMLRRPMSS